MDWTNCWMLDALDAMELTTETMPTISYPSESAVDKELILKREHSVALEWWDLRKMPLSFWNRIDKTDFL